MPRKVVLGPPRPLFTHPDSGREGLIIAFCSEGSRGFVPVHDIQGHGPVISQTRAALNLTDSDVNLPYVVTCKPSPHRSRCRAGMLARHAQHMAAQRRR